MTRSILSLCVERLVPYVMHEGDDVASLKRELDGAEQRHSFSKSKIVDFPIERHNNRTLVHIAASCGKKERLLHLLKCGGMLECGVRLECTTFNYLPEKYLAMHIIFTQSPTKICLVD